MLVLVSVVLQCVLVLVSAGVPCADPLSRRMGALRLDGESRRDQQGESPVRMVQSEAARDRHATGGAVVLVPGSGPVAGVDHNKVRRTTR